MVKRVISVIAAICMVAAFAAGAAFAAPDAGTKIEAARQAVKAVEKGQTVMTVYNDMTADEFLREVAKVLPEDSDVKVSFDKETDFRVYNATSEKDGSLFVNIRFDCETSTRHEMYSIKIPKLTGAAAEANADAEKLAEDRAAVKEIFMSRSFDNTTTQEEILAEAQSKVKNGSTVEWTEFAKVNSTTTKNGSVKGVLTLKLGNETTTIKVNNGVRLAEAETTPEETKPEETKPEENKPQEKPSFADVAADAYYANAVGWAVEKNITTGTTATTFSPDDTCTRAQIITFMWRAVGSPKAETENPFSDVSTNDYYYDAAIWADEMGMVADDKFLGDTPCTRAATVTYLWIIADSPEMADTSSFTDVPENADYAEAVAWAVENGVTSGVSATEFAPQTICSRGQIVTFLNRTLAEENKHSES